MHELLLFGQVPPKRHDQLLKILAGVAAMQPHSIVERHLVFKPRRPIASSTRAATKPGAQVQALQAQMQGDLFYLQLVGNMTGSPGSGTGEVSSQDVIVSEGGGQPDANGASNGAMGKASAEDKAIDLKAHPWSLEFRDLPDVAGHRPVTSRLMASVAITDGDPLDVIDSLGYNYTTEYVLQGHRFVHGNLILLLHRPLIVPPISTADQTNTPAPHPVHPLPPLETLRPLDLSGGFILQASVRVQDGNRPETMKAATNELVKFKEVMKGVVDMEVGDRLALDTRMR
ncbi:Mediator of RNA polymerase II transcription subunit 18 [Trapelia coarctata]|nr:Mediator of RNA polymerase II transcription subunit 18 [Trapelia coarctata]